MKSSYVDIASISDLHEFYGFSSPLHPLITWINLNDIDKTNRPQGEILYSLGFYAIIFKTFKGTLRYGRSSYDFNEGSLMFTAPYQLIATSHELKFAEGWGLFFHADLLNNS